MPRSAHADADARCLCFMIRHVYAFAARFERAFFFYAISLTAALRHEHSAGFLLIFF